MDPKATLRRLVEALELQDYREAKSAGRDLARWLSTGGFVPSDETSRTDWAFVLETLNDVQWGRQP